MRKITGNISTIVSNGYAEKELTFVLCNKYDNEINMFEDDGQIVPTSLKATTDANGNFEIVLFETEKSPLDIFYIMTFVDETIKPKKLYIPIGTSDINFIKTLIKTPAYMKDFISLNSTNTKSNINKILIENLEKYLFGDENLIPQNQKKIIEYFILYADGKVENQDMKIFDKHLATIIGEQ